MELYISDHPLDCLTCAANGDCELQDMAGVVGLREVRYGYAGENHFPRREKDESNPYFSFDPQVHRLLALRARLRGSAGHLRADHHRPRLRLQGLGRPGRSFLDSECVSCGACVQACPTATLMEKTVIEHGPAGAQVVTTCAYCGVGCSLQGRDEGRTRWCAWCPHNDGKRQPRPCLRQGPLRLGLRDAPRPHHHADDPRASPIPGAR
jgi:formate dehydrogenase major subunit